MIRISITKSGLLTVGKRGFQEIGRQSIEASVRYWWEHFLPLHFKNIAYLRYNYSQRDDGYNAMKRGRRSWGKDNPPAIGEVKPLVFTGRSRERALSSPNIRAKAPNYMTYVGQAVINAPAFNFGKGKTIDMRDEVTRLNPTEVPQLNRIFTQTWNRLARAAGLRATRQTVRTAA